MVGGRWKKLCRTLDPAEAEHHRRIEGGKGRERAPSFAKAKKISAIAAKASGMNFRRAEVIKAGDTPQRNLKLIDFI